MKTYTVIRNGKCFSCGNLSSAIIGEVDAETKEEAVLKAQDNWIYERFGQAGAMRENEIYEEEKFLEGDFIAEEVK